MGFAALRVLSRSTLGPPKIFLIGGAAGTEAAPPIRPRYSWCDINITDDCRAGARETFFTRFQAVWLSSSFTKEITMFGKRLKIFTLLGFEVRIDLSWFFIALFITWSLSVRTVPLFL